MPEGIYPFVEATLYLATAPKSNSAGANFRAVNKVEEKGKVAVPKHLQDGTPSAGDARDPSAGSGQALGHGQGYVYPHSDPAGFEVDNLPEELQGRRYYRPSGSGEKLARAWDPRRP